MAKPIVIESPEHWNRLLVQECARLGMTIDEYLRPETRKKSECFLPLVEYGAKHDEEMRSYDEAHRDEIEEYARQHGVTTFRGKDRTA